MPQQPVVVAQVLVFNIIFLISDEKDDNLLIIVFFVFYCAEHRAFNR